MTRRAAIILAGGQAERFQAESEQWEDKALAMLFGKPLIVNIVEGIREVLDEIVICVNDEARKARFSKLLREYSIDNAKICIDEKTRYVAGPLVAITTGLKFTGADYCLTIPCDVPLIQSKVVDHLFDVAGSSYVTVPIWPDGELESLIMVCRRPITVQIADVLCKLRRRRPDDIIRGASKVLFVSTVGDLKKFDPEFKSFININLRGDLTRLPTRVVEKGLVKENLRLNVSSIRESELRGLRAAARFNDEGKIEEAFSGFSSSSTHLEKAGMNFWAGVTWENEGEILFSLSKRQADAESKKDYHTRGKVAFAKAAQNYGFEAETYDKNNVTFLSKHARIDQLLCQQAAESSS